ncbi:MAG: PEGA domain-containing protein [bacterium]
MKILIKSILTFLILANTISAEEVNIITNNDKARVFINEKMRGKGNVTLNLKPGSYYIKVKVEDRLLFSELKTVNKDEVTTILAAKKNYGATFQKQEILTKENWTAALIGSTVGGLSIGKKFKNQFEVQPVFMNGGIDFFGVRGLYRFDARPYRFPWSIFSGNLQDGVAVFYGVAGIGRGSDKYVTGFTNLMVGGGVEYGLKEGLFTSFLEISYTIQSGYESDYYTNLETVTGIGLGLGIGLKF